MYYQHKLFLIVELFLIFDRVASIVIAYHNVLIYNIFALNSS
jgi:hypothetical protein